MNDRGAKALTHMLHKEEFGIEPTVETHDQPRHKGLGSECYDRAERILGTTGLFIADVTAHEPLYPEDGANMRCYCGYDWSDQMESFFDHIGGAS